MRKDPLTCFKAYDIRGKLGAELNTDIARRIGRAFGQYLCARRVVVGCDSRLSSPALKQAVADGLMDAGVNVLDLGLAGTEEIYFAAFHLDVDGGIVITASHNPLDYNGMKLVRGGAKPLSSDTGLHEIQHLAETQAFTQTAKRGRLLQQSSLAPYIDHLFGIINLAHMARMRPIRIVTNAGNGAAGHVVDALETRLATLHIPITFIKINHEPDGTFPQGIPNPLLPENRGATTEAVLAHKADMGIAWDGDFDRCFLFDERGKCIEGYYIVGLLAQAFLSQKPGEKIIHDPRLTWNTIEIVKASGGIPVQSKTGHTFIKERMRQENAIYGGEMSAHHYFRDFAYCDSGMIPWLLVVELMSTTSKPLSALVGDREATYPCSGEINYRVADTQAALKRVEAHFADLQPIVDTTDGISLECGNWRCNLRASNTEPLLRLNVESRGDAGLVTERVSEIEQVILH